MQNAMRCPFAANIGETGNPSFNSVIFHKTGDKRLAGQFAGTIVGGRKQRAIIFVDFGAAGLSVNCRSGSKHYFFDLMFHHRFQNPVSGQKRRVKINIRISVAAGNVRVGGQMKNHIKAIFGKKLVQQPLIKDISFNKRKMRRLPGRIQI